VAIVASPAAGAVFGILENGPASTRTVCGHQTIQQSNRRGLLLHLNAIVNREAMAARGKVQSTAPSINRA
jgi:hypothetical protein